MSCCLVRLQGGALFAIAVFDVPLADMSSRFFGRRDFMADLERLKSYRAGMIVTGRVRSLERFGAFVDLGGVEGLLKTHNISWRPIEYPSDVLSVGKEVTVKILDVDLQRGQISLSLKDLQPDPMIPLKEKVGSVVTGKVVKIVPFGIFVQIEEGQLGLLMNSEFTGPGAPPRPEIGEEIQVRIADVDLDSRRIRLSLP
ncbi:MAG: hypothetical protein BUE48_002770 [Thermomonospora sp. CIF 1]|nr:MAG: hypothetical protein BUE48_002770 [Thermomonospora sp. CIF 1]